MKVKLLMLTIAQQRLHAQRIAHSDFQTAHDVVQWLGALQAQDRASAAWTIGLRLPSATLATIEQALHARAIVRTWLLRGTLHIVTADDLRWMLVLIAPDVLARAASFHRKLGLDEATVTQGLRAITNALEHEQPLTRKALLAHVAQAGLTLSNMAALNLLNRAALDALICFGPMQDKQETFVLLDEWVPQGTTRARDEALAELALRYFTSHGPTTLHDFAWWAGLRAMDARAGLEAIKSQLVEEVVEGKSYWRAPSITARPEGIAEGTAEGMAEAYLLPGFDEFVLGYGDRHNFLQPEHEKLITGTNAIFAYTTVWEGQIIGTWKRTFRARHVEITLTPFAPLPPTQLEQFIAPAHRYGDFVGLPVVVH